MLRLQDIQVGQRLTALNSNWSLTGGKVYRAVASTSHGIVSGNCVYVIIDNDQCFGPYLHRFAETQHLCNCSEQDCYNYRKPPKVPRLRITTKRLLLCKRT